MNRTAKIAFACILALGPIAVLWAIISRKPASDRPTLTYSQFLDQVQGGQVASVVVKGSGVEATYKLKNSQTRRTILPPDYRDALTAMQAKLVNIEVNDSSSEPGRLFARAAPFFVLWGMWVFLMVFKIRIWPRAGAAN